MTVEIVSTSFKISSDWLGEIHADIISRKAFISSKGRKGIAKTAKLDSLVNGLFVTLAPFA